VRNLLLAPFDDPDSVPVPVAGVAAYDDADVP